MKYLISTIAIVSCFFLRAQGNQSEYLEAKRLYSANQFRDAMGAFQSLTNDPVFGRYASFYYALSAYNQELPQVALDMWKQILVKYPDWDQSLEANYWVAKVSFERSRYLEGLRYANELSEEERKALISSFEEDLDLEELQVLQQSNPENIDLARLYFQALTNQPLEERDGEELERLSRFFGFELDELVENIPLIKKDEYSLALVLPFLFDSLQNPQTVIGNKIIFELYQGMILAQDTLKKQGLMLNIYPYDTKRSGALTQNIIQSGALENADVIIGPLYTDPNKVISAYSKEKEIPMINPLSSNGGITSDNPLSFLFKPSYETQGRKAAMYASRKFSGNKRAMIFFETARDQTIAEAYKKVLEEDSFDIVMFDELTKESALQLQADWTNEYEYFMDSISQNEIDSIASIPGRYVRSRVVRDEKTGRVVKTRNGDDLLEYYEMKLTIPDDSIGHIFAATSNNLLANNIISLTEVRGDSIGVVGYDNWLDFRLVSYDQLERLDVSMIHTSCFSTEERREIEDRVRLTFTSETSEYHLLGYELVIQLARLFQEQGKYFHRGLLTGKFLDGYLMEGMSYGAYQDNQVVPIVTVKDLTLKVENRDDYED